MLKIGLTGSIGMGKTETGKIFSELGLPLYDADATVHKLYGPGQKGSEKIKEKFPNSINPDGSVNRESLSTEVLGDPEKIKSLESIIHPLVGEDRKLFFEKNAKNISNQFPHGSYLIPKPVIKKKWDGGYCMTFQQKNLISSRKNMALVSPHQESNKPVFEFGCVNSNLYHIISKDQFNPIRTAVFSFSWFTVAFSSNNREWKFFSKNFLIIVF